jgi:hypothetical protein
MVNHGNILIQMVGEELHDFKRWVKNGAHHIFLFIFNEILDFLKDWIYIVACFLESQVHYNPMKLEGDLLPYLPVDIVADLLEAPQPLLICLDSIVTPIGPERSPALWTLGRWAILGIESGVLEQKGKFCHNISSNYLCRQRLLLIV